MKKAFTTKKIILSGFFIALAYLLPYLTGQLGTLGRALSPMHLPVLIAGFVCGAPAALVVGLIAPLLRSIIAGMPPLFPVAISMALELAAYGFFTGLFYKLFAKSKARVFGSLILAMILGRVVGGIANVILLGIAGTPYTFSIFITGMFLEAIPGIILQIVLVPIIVIALEKAKVIKD